MNVGAILGIARGYMILKVSILHCRGNHTCKEEISERRGVNYLAIVTLPAGFDPFCYGIIL